MLSPDRVFIIFILYTRPFVPSDKQLYGDYMHSYNTYIFAHKIYQIIMMSTRFQFLDTPIITVSTIQIEKYKYQIETIQRSRHN